MSDAIYPKGYKAKPDNEKTDADWEIHEAITDWQQAAFNAHWYECSKFLDASEGGKQTSNDLHMLCQGYALAAARITELETALAEALRERTEARAEAANLRADLRRARNLAFDEACLSERIKQAVGSAVFLDFMTLDEPTDDVRPETLREFLQNTWLRDRSDEILKWASDVAAKAVVRDMKDRT